MIFGRCECEVEVSTVPIIEATLVDSDNGVIELSVGSCNGAPQATGSFGDEYFEVEVSAYLPKGHREACADSVRVFTNRPGEPPPEQLLDIHTGEIVPVDSGG